MAISSLKQTLKPISLSLVFTSLIACSFVELDPGATHIILANDDSNCELVEEFDASVRTKNALITRSDRAIAEELQILAMNRANELFANAIWAVNDVQSGSQRFKILLCDSLR